MDEKALTNEELAEHLVLSHGVSKWAVRPTIWGKKRDRRAMDKWHAKFHEREEAATTLMLSESPHLASLAKQREETELYEAVGPQRYERYLTWRQTPHSVFTDETGRLRNVLEDARGEALPTDTNEEDELREILGTTGYEIWIRPPRRS